jgi:hypothetical protein
MINEAFTDDLYLSALLECARSQFKIPRITNILLKENVTDEELLREAEYLAEGFNLEKATEFVKGKQKHIEKTLKEYGVSVDKLKSAGSVIGKKLKGYHEKGMKPQEASKMIVKDMVTAGTGAMMKVKKKFDLAAAAAEGAKKVLISLLFYVMIVLASSIIATILQMTGVFAIFGPAMSIMIMVIVVAPMVEEGAKNYFIQKGMPWIGTGVVFGIEAIQYIVSLMAVGMSLPSAIILRASSLLMHFSTTMIQKYIMSKATTPEEEQAAAWAGWVAGVMIHSTWNTLAIVYNGEIMKLITP